MANIFAEQLVDVLGNHDKELSDLYNLHDDDVEIYPRTVVRLKKSLTEDRTATLNSRQIDLLQAAFDLADDEVRQLRAALVAEAVRHMLGAVRYMDAAVAYQLGMVMLRMLTSEDPAQMEAACNHLLSEMRGATERDEDDADTQRGDPGDALPADAPADERIGAALDGAEEAYFQGMLWLELARESRSRDARQGLAAQGRDWLVRAASLVASPPSVALGTPQQAALQRAITQAQDDAAYL
jgi:hypothetical protein